MGTYQNTGLNAPAYDGFAITPDDSNLLSQEVRGIYIGSDGNIKVTMSGGTDVTFNGVVAGSILAIRAIKVFATGTTATNLIGLI